MTQILFLMGQLLFGMHHCVIPDAHVAWWTATLWLDVRAPIVTVMGNPARGNSAAQLWGSTRGLVK
jgi:hypothetical protein